MATVKVTEAAVEEAAVEVETVEAPVVDQATPTQLVDATEIQRAAVRPFQTSADGAIQSNEELNHRFAHLAPEGADTSLKFTKQ